MLYKISSSSFSPIEVIIQEIKNKKMVCIVDDENRENEGDLIFPAQFIQPEIINFMSQHARGLICVALDESYVQRLGLPQMIPESVNLSPNKTAFTVSVEAAHGVSTGISSADRARTIQVLSDESSQPEDLIQPGHVFPIRAQKGGVLKRAGHTEAAVDLCRLAGLNPSAVICEIMNPDGTMARLNQLKVFTKQQKIHLGSIEDLIHYRVENESYIEKKERFLFPTSYGKDFYVQVFWDPIHEIQHLAFIKGDISSEKACLVRMHAECVTGDVFADSVTHSSHFLKKSFEKIQNHDSGVLVYLRSPKEPMRSLTRILNQTQKKASKIISSEMQKMDSKDYGTGAQILRSLGVHKMILLTNSPVKRAGIRGYGLEVVETQSLNGESSFLKSK